MEFKRQFIALIVALTSVGYIIVECQYVRVPTMDDVIDVDDVIRSTGVRSILECAKKCNISVGCFAFHFNTGSKQCTEKSKLSNVTRSVNSTGTKYYQINLAMPTCPVLDGDWINVEMLNNGTIEAYQIRVLSGNFIDQAVATTHCQSLNATLPQVTTLEKLDYYRNHILFACPGIYVVNSFYYVDGTNINATNFFAPDAYVTGSGDVLHFGSGIWAPGRPARPDIENCVRFDELKEYMLNDKFCDRPTLAVICERHL